MLVGMFKRLLDIGRLVTHKSVLLLGPRQTGKSSLLRTALPGAATLDLLEGATFRLLSAKPERLGELYAERAASGQPLMVVDEIQRVPDLLFEVQRIVDRHPEARFVLTGSSARKLRRDGANLLPGRVARAWLHPLAHPERTSDPASPQSWQRAVQWGGLPGIVRQTDPRADLLDYFGIYLQEEIRAEGIARKFDAFSRFLDFAAATHGEQVVYANVARDAEISPRTLREYYGVLQDTLVGHMLPAFRGTQLRKAAATEKFYFFDAGVAHAALGRFDLQTPTAEYGTALEHLIWRELRTAMDYLDGDVQLYFWRSLSGFEVDFVLATRGTPLWGIEVKATEQVGSRDLRGLRALGEEFPQMRRLVVCRQAHPSRLEDGTQIWPVGHFLQALWSAQLIAPGPRAVTQFQNGGDAAGLVR